MPPPKASIRCAFAVQSVLSVLVAGAIAAFLSIEAGDRALRDMQDVCGAGLDDYYSFTTTTVRHLGGDLMAEVLERYASALSGLLSAPPLFVETMMRHLDANNVGKGNWSHDRVFMDQNFRSVMQSLLRVGSPSGITELQAFTLEEGALGDIGYLLMFEHYSTTNQPRGGDHAYITAEYFNSTLLLMGMDQVNGDIPMYYGASDKEGRIRPGPIPCNTTLFIESKGKQPSGKCQLGKGSNDILDGQIFGASLVDWAARNLTIGWTPVQGKGTILTMNFYHFDTNDGTRRVDPYTGAQAGVNVLSLSYSAHKLLESQPMGSRLYVTQTNPWNKSIDDTLLASSHEPAFAKLDDGSFLTLRARDSIDPIISQHARSVESFHGLEDHEWTLDNGTVYWVRVQEIEQELYSLHVHAVLLVPRDEALKTIDAARKSVEQEIDNDINNVEERVTEDRVIMIIVLACCLLVMTVISVFFATLLSRPVLRLAQQMAPVAEMQLDSVETTTKPSRLLEVADMQEAFAKMVANLREYRTYLPDAVLNKPSEDEESGEAGEEVLSCVTDNQSGSDEHSTDSKSGSTNMGELRRDESMSTAERRHSNSDTMPRRGSGGNSFGGSNPARGRRLSIFSQQPQSVPSAQPMPLSGGLTGHTLIYRKNVALMVVYMRGFAEWARNLPSESAAACIVETVALWVERVELAVSERKGMLLPSLMGDGEVVAAWGFSSRRLSCYQNAVDTALDITKSPDPLPSSAGVVDGAALTGNIGSYRVRVPALVGGHRQDCARLGRLATYLESNVLVPSTKGLQENFDILPLDVVDLHTFPSLGGRMHGLKHPMMVYQVNGRPQQLEPDEWMYQLEQMEQRRKAITHAYNLYASGNFLAARRSAEILASSEGSLQRAAINLLGLLPREDGTEHNEMSDALPSKSPVSSHASAEGITPTHLSRRLQSNFSKGSATSSPQPPSQPGSLSTPSSQRLPPATTTTTGLRRERTPPPHCINVPQHYQSSQGSTNPSSPSLPLNRSSNKAGSPRHPIGTLADPCPKSTFFTAVVPELGEPRPVDCLSRESGQSS